jgi:hypothetical protein
MTFLGRPAINHALVLSVADVGLGYNVTPFQLRSDRPFFMSSARTIGTIVDVAMS